jgi:hypothetical protein
LILRRVVANIALVPATRLLLVLFAMSAAACSKSIGDECTTNVDCSQDYNARDCDLSQPGGYCTITGCDEKSCPSEAVCIRVFPVEAGHTNLCAWYPTPSDGVLCPADPAPADLTACVCPADQICIPDGFCVPRASERRFCEKSCSSNSDCRSGYVCREAGVEGHAATTSTYGSIALVSNPTQRGPVKFCTAGQP